MSSREGELRGSQGFHKPRGAHPQHQPLINAAVQMKTSVVFQSRTASVSPAAAEYCAPDLVFLSMADIRALKCRIGSYVSINFASGDGMSRSLLCRVWPSPKVLGSGRATLNRIWWPNFPAGDQAARSATLVKDTGQNSLAVCTHVTLIVHNKSGLEGCSAIGSGGIVSPLFTSYVVGCLEGVPLVAGLMLGMTWKGQPCLVSVRTVEQRGEEFDGSEGLDRRHLVDFSTSISILQEGLADGGGEEQGQQPQEHHLSAFAGYSSQLDECLHLMHLGLLLGESGQRFAELGVTRRESGKTSQLTSQLFKPPRGLLIHGPPGTGKSALVKTLVKTLGCASIDISYSLLQHKFVGEAEVELQRVFDYATSHAPCCVLMDDADLLCKSRSDSQASALQRRIVSCLLSLLDGIKTTGNSNGVFVIAATTHPNSIDPAFRRPGRFDKEIEVGVPNAVQREAILTALVEDSKLLLAGHPGAAGVEITSQGIGQVAKQAHGMVGSDLLQVLKEAQLLALSRVEGDVGDTVASVATVTASLHALSLASSVSVTDTDLAQALSKVPPSALREIVVEIPTTYWADIGGMDSVKQSLREVVEWPLLYPQLFSAFAVHPPRGVLLYGPPGCSKTLMAKALATEGGMNFLTVRGPELLSKWLGESEKAVQTLFRRARAAAPSVVFFDEIDALAGKRGSSSAGVNDRVLAQLLSELDGIQSGKDAQRVIVVAATNRPDMLDTALIRPGRIDRKVYVPPPDRLSREQIFRLELLKIPTASDLDVARLAELSDGFSGAEVVAVCTEAAMLAMDESRDVITQDLLEQVAKSIKPQITQSMLEFYTALKL